MTKRSIGAANVELEDDELEDDDAPSQELGDDEDDLDDEDDGCPKGDPECISRADESHDACEAPAAISKPAAPSVRESFTQLALQGLPAKMRDRPLAAQSNQWIQSTLGRLIFDNPRADSPVVDDIFRLSEAAAQRGFWGDFSTETHRAVALLRAARASTPEVVGSSPTVAGDSDVVQLDRAPGPQSEERASNGDAPAERSLGELRDIPISEITPDPDQPREDADDELADSIRANGVLQPITVRVVQGADETAAYMIVDGERRYRGSIKAGRTTIPARVVDDELDEGDRLLHQVVFNDGKRLAPMEEARAWKRIMASKGWTAQQLAQSIGRGKSTVSDRLALLDAPTQLLSYFERGLLSTAAAPIVRPLAGLPAKALARVVNEIADDWKFQDAGREFTASGKPMPLKDFEKLVGDILDDVLAAIDPALGVVYKGKTAQIGDVTYAIDADAYRAAAEKVKAGIKKPAPVVTAAEAKRKADEKARSAKAAADRQKEEDARALKKRLRRAQFAAVSAKLPNAIDGKLALVLIASVTPGYIADEQLDVLGIARKGGSYRNSKQVLEHAAKLDTKGRIQLLLKIAIYDEQPPHDASNDRLAAVAKALNVDLKKVKLPAPEFPAGTTAAAESAKVKATVKASAKKSPAKSTPKKRR